MCANQATLSTEGRSEEAMESFTTETEPSTSQNGAAKSVPNQLSGSSLIQLTPSTTTAKGKHVQRERPLTANIQQVRTVKLLVNF